MTPFQPPPAAPARVRAIAGWATATMIPVGAFTVLYLLYAFSPLVDMWAVRQVASSGGGTPAAVATLVRLVLLALLVVTYLLAGVCFVVWLTRARLNLAAFADAMPRTPKWYPVAVWFIPVANLLTPPLIVTDVARGTAPRTRLGGLVWTWWLLFLAGLMAAVAGLVSTAPERGELNLLRDRLGDGDSVDRGLAAELIGGQIVGRLPSAVLLFGSAVCLMVLVARITERQYARLDALRPPPGVMIPTHQIPGQRTAVLPNRPSGATI